MTKKENKKEYNFAVGSFKFKSFASLYDNIKGRTGNTKLNCSIVDETDKAIMGFPLSYEVNPMTGRNRFAFEWETTQLNQFKANPDAAAQLRQYLPKFQAVGSTAKTAAGVAGPTQKLYGFLNVADLK